jgi:hypothetical protein
VQFLHLFCDFGKILSVSMQLQSSAVDLSAAVGLVKILLSVLKEQTDWHFCLFSVLLRCGFGL